MPPPTSPFFHFFPALSFFSVFLPFSSAFFFFFQSLTVFTFVCSYISDVLLALFPFFLLHCGYMGAKSLQSCLILCHPMDCSPPGSSVRGILQARTLEWVYMPSSGGSFWPRDRNHISYESCTAGEFFTAELLGKPPEDMSTRRKIIRVINAISLQQSSLSARHMHNIFTNFEDT